MFWTWCNFEWIVTVWKRKWIKYSRHQYHHTLTISEMEIRIFITIWNNLFPVLNVYPFTYLYTKERNAISRIHIIMFARYLSNVPMEIATKKQVLIKFLFVVSHGRCIHSYISYSKDRSTLILRNILSHRNNTFL